MQLDSEVDLRIRWYKYVSVNSLILVVVLWLYRKMPLFTGMGHHLGNILVLSNGCWRRVLCTTFYNFVFSHYMKSI